MWLMLQTEIDRIEAYEREHVAQSELDGAIRAIEPMHMGRGKVATIQVKGPLFNSRRPLLDFFGVDYTTYGDVIYQSAAAVKAGARRADYYFDTPGGTTDGMYSAMSAIKDMPIKTRSIAGPTMASAGFMLGSQTNEIIAENDMSIIGSVGVAMDVDTRKGVKSIANSDSPKKRPDTSTDEGIADAREPLDDVFQVLAEKIAIGRGVTAETVKNEYGQGAVMTARTALQRRMIDAIGGAASKSTAPKQAAKQESRMDAKELKEEHRGTYDAVFEAGRQNGIEAGQATERGNARAHLNLADVSGDYKSAHDGIREGLEVTTEIQSLHQAALMKKAMIAQREGENADDTGTGAAAADLDEAQETKKGLEASCPGLVVEVL